MQVSLWCHSTCSGLRPMRMDRTFEKKLARSGLRGGSLWRKQYNFFSSFSSSPSLSLIWLTSEVSNSHDMLGYLQEIKHSLSKNLRKSTQKKIKWHNMKIKQGKLVYIYYGIYEILNGTTTVEKNQVSKTVKNSGNSWAVSQPEAAAPLHTTGGLHWQEGRTQSITTPTGAASERRQAEAEGAERWSQGPGAHDEDCRQSSPAGWDPTQCWHNSGWGPERFLHFGLRPMLALLTSAHGQSGTCAHCIRAIKWGRHWSQLTLGKHPDQMASLEDSCSFSLYFTCIQVVYFWLALSLHSPCDQFSAFQSPVLGACDE